MGYFITRRSYTLALLGPLTWTVAVSAELGKHSEDLIIRKQESGDGVLGLHYDLPNLWPG